MKERDGGVNEERVRRGEIADDPIGGLEKETSKDYAEKLRPLVEQDLEQNGDEP